MNEPLITLRETEEGRPVRCFADGATPPAGGAFRQDGSGHGFIVEKLFPRVRASAAQLGYAAAMLAKAGFRLVARR